MTSPARSIHLREECTSHLGDPFIHRLTLVQSMGMTLAMQSGIISLLATLFAWGIIFFRIIRHIRYIPSRTIWRECMDVIMVSSFLSDLVQAIYATKGNSQVDDWIRGRRMGNSLCTTQAIIQQLADDGVAVNTLLFAIYVFISVWRRMAPIPAIAKVILGFLWIFIILIGVREKQCAFQSLPLLRFWIGQGYGGFHVWNEYVWLWTSFTSSLSIYAAYFLWSRGNIKRSKTSWWMFSIDTTPGTIGSRSVTSEVMINIFYPLVYFILVFPVSVIRWVDSVPRSTSAGRVRRSRTSR